MCIRDRLYCADCGGKMYVHRTNNGKRISQYTCSQYTKVPCGTLCKTQHRINEDVVQMCIRDRGCPDKKESTDTRSQVSSSER